MLLILRKLSMVSYVFLVILDFKMGNNIVHIGDGCLYFN